QRFEPKSLDKRNVTFIVNNYTEMQDAANALERQHSMAESRMIVSIEGLLGRDLKAAGDEDVAQLTDDKCRKALCMMLKLHAHQCVSNVTSEARYSVRQAGYDHLDDVSEKYEKLAKQLAAKVDRLEEEVQEYERAAASTAKVHRELRDIAKKIMLLLKDKPTSAIAKETEDERVPKAQFDALQKQCGDLMEKNKQLSDDVDCMRIDRERKQEEIDRLRAQLDKIRAEKNASGAAKGAKKTKK
ncbi:hypothetical protein AAVH_34469, partial [Aphelenchoides avenae]